MAVTKQAMYDNAAYLAVNQAGGTLSGNAGQVRFAAFTSVLLKSIQLNYITAGTAADAKTMLVITGGTSTTTTVIHTRTAFTGSVNYLPAATTLSAGDTVSVLKGADATEISVVTFETVLQPGTSVTP